MVMPFQRACRRIRDLVRRGRPGAGYGCSSIDGHEVIGWRGGSREHGSIEALRIATADLGEALRIARAWFGAACVAAERAFDDFSRAWTFWVAERPYPVVPPRPYAVRWIDPRQAAAGITRSRDRVTIGRFELVRIED